VAAGAAGTLLEREHELTEFGQVLTAAQHGRGRCVLVQAAAGLGKTSLLRRMALDDLDRARRWGAASGIGVALRASALVTGGPASVDLLRQAAAILTESPARLEHARALTDLGAALRRANRRAEARGPLQDGLRLAGQCGADALAGRARTELRAAGGGRASLNAPGCCG
jgi:hypothetical protein